MIRIQSQDIIKKIKDAKNAKNAKNDKNSKNLKASSINKRYLENNKSNWN